MIGCVEKEGQVRPCRTPWANAPSAICASLLLAALALQAAPASAATTYPYTGTSFGPTGPGTFGNVQAVAVDQNTGSVYVFDAGIGSIYKFNAAGVPQEFTALKSNAIATTGGKGTEEEQLAIDSSTGPAKGDLYLAEGGGGSVAIFDSQTGASLGQLDKNVASEVPGAKWGEPCGVAVDPNGNVYVGIAKGEANGAVNRYIPKAGPVTNTDYTSAITGLDTPSGGEICNIAVDSQESVYVSRYETGPTRKFFAGEFGHEGVGTVFTTGRGTLAVDPASNDVFVDRQNEIVQYSASAEVRGRSGAAGAGALSGSFGVAVNGTTASLYASAEEGRSVAIFGPVATVADAATDAASAVRKTNATVSGTVNPLELGEATYHFQYGTTTAYGSETAETKAGNGNAPVPISETVTGLERETTYHYRLVVVDASGTSVGEDRTFTTVGTVFVSPCTPTNVRATSATLTGTTDPEGVPAQYSFLYGLSPEEARTLPQERTGEEEQPISVVVEGLIPRRLYHCQMFGEKAEIEPGANIGPDSTFTTPIAAPAVNDQAPFAAGVSLHEATLHGAVNPGNGRTAYHFIYGLTGAYGSSTPATYTTENYAEDEVQQLIMGLQPGTVYHYALVASNESGTTTGPDQTFATLAGAAPTVETGGVSAVGTTAATISGALDPAGQATTWEFEVGTSTSYGTQIFGTTSTSETVSAGLTGLLPATVYHYRLRASDASGTTYGADHTLSTLPAPSVLQQPATLALVATPALTFPREETHPPTKKTLTTAQKLAHALKACRRKHGRQRARCERQARKKYGHRSK
jgi:hypothetical protein